jgi:parvulin-like peptidyl-prolyl isomerase
MKPASLLPALLPVLVACADLTAPSGPMTSASPEPTAAPQPARPNPADAPVARDQGGTRIRASHILIAYQGAARSKATRSKDDAKKLAESVLKRVQSGSDFATLAKEVSDDPTAKERGGDLGSFDRYTMTKPFADAAFALSVGQTSGIVETEFGFHIIKRTE